MVWIRAIFLLVVFISTSGFGFRCYWLCTDQTSVQDDYVEQRDRCREYAQLKYGAMTGDEDGGAADGQSRNATLVRLFSECMAEHGWTVPSGEGGHAQTVQEAPVAPTTPLSSATTRLHERSQFTAAAVAAPPPANVSDGAVLARTAECDFAREAASVSHIAAERAEACDLECAQALKANPNGRRPAACPSDSTPSPSPAATATHDRKPLPTVMPPVAPVARPAASKHPRHKTRPEAPPPTPQPAPAPQPAPQPSPPPSPALPPSPPAAGPSAPPPATPAPEETTAGRLLSGLLAANLALLLILLALHVALRHARRRNAPAMPRRTPSLSAKIRTRSHD
ncbi:MAG: hypothetical protein KGI29_04780 [Pseudomonadota bacterium]|nr:hypothetical protein [Pseudomonadota bacterium]MDE3037765.1 hypothetical protein [Pseudomonadota bacterium]